MGPHISCLLKGIARWDSKLIEIARRDLVFHYFEVARWDLTFHVGNKESLDGIPSCLRSSEGISCFAIWRSPDGTSYFMLVKRNRQMGFEVD